MPSTAYMESVVFRTRLDLFCKFYQVLPHAFRPHRMHATYCYRM